MGDRDFRPTGVDGDDDDDDDGGEAFCRFGSAVSAATTSQSQIVIDQRFHAAFFVSVASFTSSYTSSFVRAALSYYDEGRVHAFVGSLASLLFDSASAAFAI